MGCYTVHAQNLERVAVQVKGVLGGPSMGEFSGVWLPAEFHAGVPFEKRNHFDNGLSVTKWDDPRRPVTVMSSSLLKLPEWGRG